MCHSNILAVLAGWLTGWLSDWLTDWLDDGCSYNERRMPGCLDVSQAGRMAPLLVVIPKMEESQTTS